MSGSLTYIRISLGLVVLTCSIIVGLDLAGVLPRQSSSMSESRIQFCESLALQAISTVNRNDFASMRRMFDAVARRNEDVLSIGMRKEGGHLLVTTMNHTTVWQPESDEGSTMTHARIPLIRKGEQWGMIEVRFEDPNPLGFVQSLWKITLIRVLVFFSIASFLAYTIYMKRLLRYLDPTSVIPPRVQATLDVMSEGVILLDQNGRIVLANSTFADQIDRPAETLLGVKASDLGWLVPKSLEPARDLPWQRALDDAERHTGTPLCIKVGADDVQTFIVNGAPVAEESGKARGAIATFDNITELERKTEQLEQVLVLVEKSRDETRFRNDELLVLATCDPLTGIVNRRAFMERAELEFETTVRERRKMCCVMVDIDHFKLVNDNHGHSMGDEVICRLAQELVVAWPDRDLVCRFGGEEFCMLLVDTDLEEVVALTSRLRRSIAAKGFAPVPVTASFGVSSMDSEPPRFYDLLEQADQALYASKDNGRNRVTTFSEISAGA